MIVAGSTLGAAIVGAGTPTVLWQKPGVRTGLDSTLFSADGSLVLLAISGGFEVRRSSDGVLQNTLTLPADARAYDARAWSHDKTLVGLTQFRGGVGVIELWRVADGTLVRTITTDAVRTIKGLDFSSTGLIASRERFAYGGGGHLRVHRVSDGSLVKKLGPVARNSAGGGVGFSRDGVYLAVNDNNQSGLWVLRTSDWGTARLISGAAFFRWASDNTSVWTSSYERIRIPDGALLGSIPQNGTSMTTAITPDNRFAYTWEMVNNTASNLLKFLRATDGGAQLTYTFGNGTIVWSDKVNSTQTVFTYLICPSDCTVYVASMPSL
jgi:hypothetical protein